VPDGTDTGPLNSVTSTSNTSATVNVSVFDVVVCGVPPTS
jgi:hypothetical protein